MEQNTGFGPLEVGDDYLVLACTPTGATKLNASYADMAQIHEGCNEERPWGPNCNAAIKRHCRALGYESGFGPLEHSGDYLGIVCLSR